MLENSQTRLSNFDHALYSNRILIDALNTKVKELRGIISDISIDTEDILKYRIPALKALVENIVTDFSDDNKNQIISSVNTSNEVHNLEEMYKLSKTFLNKLSEIAQVRKESGYDVWLDRKTKFMTRNLTEILDNKIKKGDYSVGENYIEILRGKIKDGSINTVEQLYSMMYI